ncbi:hypothetical protein GR927_12195 [Mycolicibacterium sp. 3033]|nr:hypothetical protein [Mycolicibacterium aurantiacum]
MVAGGMAGWVLAVAGPHGAQQTATMSTPQRVAPVAMTEDVRRVGQVTAVSPHSLTTVDGDGRTTTFAITPDTTRILSPGSAAVRPTQHVVVLGTVRDGVLVATAIADRDSANGGGPPMDYQLPN